FAHDGKMLAVSGGREIALFDPASGKELRRLAAKDGAFWALAFSPDGRLAAGHSDEQLWLWDAATGKEVARWKGDRRGFPTLAWGFTHVAWSPDGRFLASASSIDPGVHLWHPTTAKELMRFQVPKQAASEATIHSMVLSADARIVASVAQDRAIRVWETLTGKELCHFQVPEDKGPGEGPRNTIALSPDGRTLACSSGRDPRVLLWDVTGRRTTPKLEPATFTREQLLGFWSDLAGAEGARAHDAACALVAAGEPAGGILE